MKKSNNNETENEMEWVVDATSTVNINFNVDVNSVIDSSLNMKISLVTQQDECKKSQAISSQRKQTEIGKEESVVLIAKVGEKRFHTVGTANPSVCHCSFPLTFHFSFERQTAENITCIPPGFVVQSEAVLPRYTPPQAKPVRQSLPSEYFRNENALRDLYDSLVKVHGLVESNTRYSRFVKLFGNQNMDKPINWVKSVASLTYFLDRLYKAGLISVDRKGFWQSAERCFVVHGKYKDNLRTYKLESEKVRKTIDKIISNVMIYKPKNK